MPQWSKYQINFTSASTYAEPIYEVQEFYAVFTSPTGRALRINGFWDGGTDWKVRFAPDELGDWTYTTYCSDSLNQGLHKNFRRLYLCPRISVIWPSTNMVASNISLAPITCPIKTALHSFGLPVPPGMGL